MSIPGGSCGTPRKKPGISTISITQNISFGGTYDIEVGEECVYTGSFSGAGSKTWNWELIPCKSYFGDPDYVPPKYGFLACRSECGCGGCVSDSVAFLLQGTMDYLTFNAQHQRSKTSGGEACDAEDIDETREVSFGVTPGIGNPYKMETLQIGPNPEDVMVFPVPFPCKYFMQFGSIGGTGGSLLYVPAAYETDSSAGLYLSEFKGTYTLSRNVEYNDLFLAPPATLTEVLTISIA